MARDEDGSLAPIHGALKRRLQSVDELNQDCSFFISAEPWVAWRFLGMRSEGTVSPVFL